MCEDIEDNDKDQFKELVGSSHSLKEVLRLATTVASTDTTVLILGETGTGKELVARAIHRLSRRAGNRFVKLNCAAVPSELLESEFFGYEKGAFTGAARAKAGLFELADRGTLFLDEVGDLPIALQPKLLRVLEDHEFEHLGATNTVKINVRLIAATNSDLSQKIRDGVFRSDLLYRLRVFPICIPALRERKDDIPELVENFVAKFGRSYAKSIHRVPNELMQTLLQWDWPGNIRELEHFIERCVLLSPGPVLTAPLDELRSRSRLRGDPFEVRQAERERILRALKETRGVISGRFGAATRLGMVRTTLYSAMKTLKITKQDYMPGC